MDTAAMPAIRTLLLLILLVCASIVGAVDIPDAPDYLGEFRNALRRMSWRLRKLRAAAPPPRSAHGSRFWRAS